MALLRQTQLGLAALILTTFLGLSSIAEGIKQELWLYTDDDNALYFQNHVPDLSIYNSVLPKITRKCETGRWLSFEKTNYKNRVTSGFGDWMTNGNLICSNITATNIKSLRHWGASDTSTDTLSLYSGKNYDGKEFAITAKAKTDINVPIRSIAATGTTDWLVFEGKSLDGHGVCFQVPSLGVFNYNQLPDAQINMTTFGSVFRGCNLREVELYKKLNAQ